jgi:hypothetical protein
MKFEYYKAVDGWRWRLRAANGEIIAAGEAYQNKADCVEVFSILGRRFFLNGEVEPVEVDA